MHSSTLAGLLSTVMSDTMNEGPLSWEEAGLTGEPAEPSRSFLAAHTVHASAPDFTSTEMEDEDLATVVSQEVPFMMPGGGDGMTVQSGPFPVAPMSGSHPGISRPPPPPPPRPSGPSPVASAPISAAAALPMPTPTPMEPPSHTQPRRLVQRPAQQQNSFAQFQPPPPTVGTGTADSGSLDFEVDPRSIVYSDQPARGQGESKAGGCLVQIVSMTVLVLALAIAVVLAYRAGLFHELFGDPIQPVQAPIDPNADPNAVDPNAVDPNAVDPNAPADPNAEAAAMQP